MANRKVTVLNPAGYQEQLQSGDVAIFDNNNVVLGTNKITLLSGTGVAELTGSVQVGLGADTGIYHTSVTPGDVSIYTPSGANSSVIFKIKEGSNDTVTITADGSATFNEGTFSGALSATTGTFSGEVSGTSATFSGALEAASIDGGTY